MPIEATAVSDDLLEQRVRYDVIDPQSQRQDELHQLVIVIVRLASTQEANLLGLERDPELPQRFDVFVKGALACCSSKPELRQHPERLAVIEIDLWERSRQRGRRLWRQAAHCIVRCTTFHLDPDHDAPPWFGNEAPSQSALVFADFPAKINVFENGDGVPHNRRRG